MFCNTQSAGREPTFSRVQTVDTSDWTSASSMAGRVSVAVRHRRQQRMEIPIWGTQYTTTRRPTDHEIAIGARMIV